MIPMFLLSFTCCPLSQLRQLHYDVSSAQILALLSNAILNGCTTSAAL
jgi:hypothetical protein